MRFEKACIPHGAYWSTPFCRWQGSFSNRHALRFCAEVTANALREREIDVGELDGLFLGTTIPQQSSFYGAPWIAGLIGAPTLAGPTFSQACATSGRVIASAAAEIECGAQSAILAVLGDRTSNSPHVYYPDPGGIGGVGKAEDWVWDNFSGDPFAGQSMVQTAENAANRLGIDRAEQDEIALMRYEQYLEALEDDRAFHRRYMVGPLEVKDPSGRKTIGQVEDDEGVFPTTAEGLAKLRPVIEGGTVTYGSQTHPADGNAGVIVTTPDRAARLSRDPSISIRIVTFAQGRAEKGFMALATAIAAKEALRRAELHIDDVKAIKTHNPFAVNDACFAREMRIDPSAMNRFGSSLVWGHPQAPTGARLLIELIEELVIVGGGHGLFAGCSAGDTALALIVKVG